MRRDPIPITAYDLGLRWVGVKEVEGEHHNPEILSWLTLDTDWPTSDEVPWCSAYVNKICWMLRLPRSKSLRARSWLQVGTPVSLADAQVGFTVAILKRGGGQQPGPDVIKAPGHVGFYAGREGSRVLLLSGNQANAVNVTGYPASRLLGLREL